MIQKIKIENFRAMSNVEIPLDAPIIAIAGQNGVQKSSLLGMIVHPFSLKNREDPLSRAKTISGRAFGSDIRTKFKFSKKFDEPGKHRWSVFFQDHAGEMKEVRCVSSKRSKDDSGWRFSDPLKKKGTGYIHFPTIYLSLRRLFPLGEIKSVNKGKVVLTKSEEKFLSICHNEILMITDKPEGVKPLGGSQKQTAGVSTKIYDAETMSAGQDNVGEILLSVMSLKKLKGDYPRNYHGGIIAIDELDASLFPASQIKLVDKMIEWARAYSIQFVFTTHSQTLLKTLSLNKYRKYAKTIYLHRERGQIVPYVNPSVRKMDSDLMVGIGCDDTRIRLYSEDEVTLTFLDELLTEAQKAKLDVLRGMSFGASTYRDLFDKGVQEFKTNLIVLDGDMEDENKGVLACNRETYYNFVCLPRNSYPEKYLYNFFSNLDEDDPFWESQMAGYDKQRCFRDVPARVAGKQDIKKWFAMQDKLRANGGRLLVRRWMESSADDVKKFRDQVDAVIARLAQWH